MKYIFFTMAILVLCSAKIFASYDYIISTEYYHGTLNLIDQSVLVSGAGAEKIVANGLSHVEINLPWPNENEYYDVQFITLNNSSTMNLDSGRISGLTLYDNSFVKVNGSRLTDSSLRGNSSIEVTGGKAGSLFASENSRIKQTKGHTGFIAMRDNASAIISGGQIDYISSYQYSGLTKHITFICDVDSVVLAGDLLTGNWLGDNGSFSIILNDQAGYDSVYSNINFIPEPATLAMLGLGGLVLRLKKK